MVGHAASPEGRTSQRRLADEVCTLVHGGEETVRADLAARGLFGATPPTVEILEALRGIVPETIVELAVLGGQESLVDALVASGLCGSRGDARRTIAGGGVSVNGERQSGGASALPVGALVDGRFVLLQRGKRTRHLLVVE